MLLHGIFPPITTPFYPHGNVYFKKLEANVERYSKTPVAGIVALGSTGEAILLSDMERRDVLQSTREASAPSKVLIAGTGWNPPTRRCNSPSMRPRLATTLLWCARRIFIANRWRRRTCWRFTGSLPIARRCQC